MLRSFRFARPAVLAVLPLAAALAGCGDDLIVPPPPPEAQIATTTFAPSLDIRLPEFTVTASGLHYKDLLVGTGDSTAAAGKALKVHYIGWLPNGTVFDQSSPDLPPFSFTLGTGAVIRGWDEGLVGMKVGGRRMLIIPPSLGYGHQATGRIPANSVLVFRVDLHEAKGTAPTGPR